MRKRHEIEEQSLLVTKVTHKENYADAAKTNIDEPIMLKMTF